MKAIKMHGCKNKKCPEIEVCMHGKTHLHSYECDDTVGKCKKCIKIKKVLQKEGK
ncbi:MAG: hypothetical protein PHX21_12675 [bacterium]|nr:hypothetical protein [bacterium]